MDLESLYREHALPLTAFFLRRTRDAQTAADLTAETFACALEGAERFDPDKGEPVGWLYGIARNQLAVFERRHWVEEKARRRLGMERLELTDTAIARLEEAAAREVTAVALQEAMADLSADQREALTARVVEERDYAEIAATTGSAEPAVRQRVSRALSRLRSREELR